MLSAILLLLTASVLCSAVNFIHFTYLSTALSCAFAILSAVFTAVHAKRRKADYDGRVDGVTLDFDREETPLGEPDPKLLALEEECKRLNNEVARVAGLTSQKGEVIAEARERVTKLPLAQGESDITATIAKMGMKAVESRRNIYRIKEQLETDAADLDKIAAELRSSVLSKSRIPKRQELNLVESGNKLRSFCSSLEEFADQMNIIAINAAIEAARIGKEGRGFSVIAGEMQKLSDEVEKLSHGLRKHGEGEAELRRSVEKKESAGHESEKRTEELFNRFRETMVTLAEKVHGISDPSENGWMEEAIDEVGLVVDRYGELASSLEALRSVLADADE